MALNSTGFKLKYKENDPGDASIFVNGMLISTPKGEAVQKKPIKKTVIIISLFIFHDFKYNLLLKIYTMVHTQKMETAISHFYVYVNLLSKFVCFQPQEHLSPKRRQKIFQVLLRWPSL